MLKRFPQLHDNFMRYISKVEHGPHTGYRPDIDGLRAVAIVSVVIFHAFPSALPGGFVGVDIFFVISGFLISTIIFRGCQQGNFSFSEFYAHRIKRIFPALIIVLIACYVCGWFILLPDEFRLLGKHIAASAGFIQNFILWQEVGYFDTDAELKPLLHLWSLAIEEQFYLFYPVLIFVAWRIGLKIFIILVLLIMISFLLNVKGIDASPTKIFFMPQYRIWELLVGSMLAYLSFFKGTQFSAWMQGHTHYLRLFFEPNEPARRGAMFNSIISIGGFFSIIFSVVILTKSKPFPGWWALLPVLGTFFLILAGPGAWINRIILTNRIAVFIGLISYPLYLWHWPILAFARLVEGEMLSGKIRTAAVALSVLLAWLTYQLIERPIRFDSTIRFKNAILILGLVVVGYIGFITFSKNGFVFRIPSEVRKIADFQYEFTKDARAGICWLSAQDPAHGFGNDCIKAPDSEGKNLILLWGDSHAARLYPGLRRTLGDQVSISQLTRDSCPPILGFGYPMCQIGNDFVLSTVRQHSPTTVILFAVWNHYTTDWLSDSQIRRELLATVIKLKQLGVKDVVILGPAPYWAQALPKLLYKEWKGSFPHKIPNRLSRGLNSDAQKVDEQLENIFASEKIRYVSLIKIFCQVDGCLTHIPDQPSELLTWDYGHLTTAGAEFLSRYLMKENIFP